MDKRMSRTMEGNSVEDLPLSNGVMGSQSNWSRCNSFSSSSNDSAVFCTNHHQRPNFAVGKRLTSEERSSHPSKRSRYSSGSSASSNLSCISDKDSKNMPVLLSAEPISSMNDTNVRNLGNLSNLSSISTSTLALQHEALLNNRLPHPMDMDTVLPFRHNLRRNIRKKTCSCDCTATCTTVVVSRQYKGIGEKTVEEKTVISRTKVKTYVERSSAQVSPVSKVQMSTSNVSYSKNASHRSESNRKRRSEIEKLYDSLHEIKWAKNFSPDNILRQFDVRQAASCSAFGRSPGDKPAEKPRTPKRQKFTYNQSNKTTPQKSSSTKLKSPLNNANNSYATRSKRRSPENVACTSKLTEDSPPVLEKSVVEDSDLLDINSSSFGTYPILSKEMFTPEKGLAGKQNKILSKNFDYSDFNSIQTTCSSCKNIDHFPKKVLSFELKSQSIGDAIDNINDVAPTFFDIAEEGIRTIDACFREVGAEVVVSTCYETDYKLPRLTSVEEIESSKATSVSNESPPILEPLLSTESLNSEKLSSGVSPNAALKNDNVIGEISSVHALKPSCSSIKHPVQTFFPLIDSKSLREEEYSPPITCFNNIERTRTVECFHEVKTEVMVDNDFETKSFLPHLMSVEETKCVDQNSILEQEPPVLEPCLNVQDKTLSLKIEPEKELDAKNIKGEIDRENFSKEIKETAEVNTKTNINFINKETRMITKQYKETGQIHNTITGRLLTKSLIIAAGRRIFNKYLRFICSKSKKQNLPFILPKKSLQDNKINKHVITHSNTSGNLKKNLLLQDESLPTIISSEVSISHNSCHYIPDSFKNIDASSLSFNSSPRFADSVITGDGCISQALESCHQTSESVLKTDDATVIRTFNQKMCYSESPEKVSLNQISNSSIFFRSKKEPDKYSTVTTKRSRKSSVINNNSNQHLEHFSDISGYAKILSEAKKKENRATDTVKVPRVFTCHYQTINVIHGSNYIQIVLKITRGKSIFLTQESLIELKEAVTKAGNDSDCRLLILNGFGQTFCLGLDLRPLIGERKNQAVGEIANAVKDLITTLADFHKPLVAIVNGAAYGLGLTILNHADVTLATNNASFCMPYSKLGYMPEGGATLTLPQTVGTTVAMDLILRGQVITAQQARDIGLINEVVEVHHLPQDLVSRVQTMAENSISGMETTKAMIKMRLHIQLPMVLETEARLLPQMWLSPSCQEAIQRALNSGFLADC